MQKRPFYKNRRFCLPIPIVRPTLDDFQIFFSIDAKDDAILLVNMNTPVPRKIPFQRLRLAAALIANRSISFSSLLIFFNTALSFVCQLMYSSHASSSHSFLIHPPRAVHAPSAWLFRSEWQPPAHEGLAYSLPNKTDRGQP